MKTFLFYDIETSGLSPAFDQILTFAAIRTDTNFKELDRYSFTVNLRKDIIPSPKAFITHCLSFDELAGGICEYDAALKIHEIINTPDTISLGYNSFNFDDEFLRFMFYRNLLDPYSHQYKDGCKRMDVLPITVIYHIFNPECLNWPQINKKTSLRLDLITAENDFITHGKAHEAMNDVEALIELVKRLSSANQDIWSYCLNFFNKTQDSQRIDNIQNNFKVGDRQFKLGIMASLSFGTKRNYLAPVMNIGKSLPYANQSLWMRLDKMQNTIQKEQTPDPNYPDNPAYQDESDKSDMDNFPVIRKKMGDELFILPPLERFTEKLTELSRQSAKKNLLKIRNDSGKFFELVNSHVEYRYPDIPDIDPDAALYQEGFFSSQEKMQAGLFHQAERDEKYKLIDELQSGRVTILAKRIIYRNSMMSSSEKQDRNAETFFEYSGRVFPPGDDSVKGYKGDTKFNYKQGVEELKEIEKAGEALSSEQKKVLAELREYIEELPL